MKLLIILLVLFSERFLMHKLAEKRVSWIHWIQAFFVDLAAKIKPFENKAMKTVLMILPIWLVIAGVYWCIYENLWGISLFIINLIIFYFCVGPMNIFYPDEKEGVGVNHLVVANSAIFAPIFWYLLLGPLFLLAYRLIDLARYHQEEQVYCQTVIEWLNWIPARLTSLCYLFIGHFQRGLEPFGQYFFDKPKDNDILIHDCAIAALSEDQKSLTEIEAEKALEHSLILYLVFIAIITILAWF